MCFSLWVSLRNIPREKQQFLEGTSFFETLFFLPRRKFVSSILRLCFLPLDIMNIWCNHSNAKMHCCANYKIWVKVERHLDMFLSERICQQFYFCDIVCFHLFKKFTKRLQQVIHVQQFLVTCLVNRFFILKYFQRL